MIKQVKYKKDETWYIGKHGLGRQLGIDLQVLDYSKTVALSPINTRGQSSSATLNVPLRDIPELIKALKEMAQGYSNTLTPTTPAITQTNKNETKKGKD